MGLPFVRLAHPSSASLTPSGYHDQGRVVLALGGGAVTDKVALQFGSLPEAITLERRDMTMRTMLKVRPFAHLSGDAWGSSATIFNTQSQRASTGERVRFRVQHDM